MPDRVSMPAWLYEALPYVYVGTGLLVAIKMDHLLALFGGLLLISAGIVVWRSRMIYRTAAEHTPTRHRHADSKAPARHVEGDLIRLNWNSSLETGVANIDSQHRKLFALGNDLLNAIIDRKPKLDVELLLDELMHDIANHFCTEESLLTRIKHPYLNEHRAIHHRLLGQAKSMAAEYHEGRLKAGDLFHFVAVEVIMGHIVNDDLKYHAIEEAAAGCDGMP